MGIGNNVFSNSVAAVRLRIRQPIKERAFFRVFDLVVQIATFLMAEGFAVGNEELKIAGVGAVHVGIVNLIDDAMAQGEPNAATGMVGGADALFGAARPAGLDAWRAKGNCPVGRI